MKKLTELTEKEYKGLKELGLLFEFYPEAVGSFNVDVKQKFRVSYKRAIDLLIKTERVLYRNIEPDLWQEIDEFLDEVGVKRD